MTAWEKFNLVGYVVAIPLWFLWSLQVDSVLERGLTGGMACLSSFFFAICLASLAHRSDN